MVARDELRSAQRTSARSQQRFDTATVQPALPCPDGAGHGPQVLVSDLQRREAAQIAGVSFLELAGNLPRHRQRPGEAAPKWLGLPGQVDRQLLAWRSVLVRTERLPQLHRLRYHSSQPPLRHWQYRLVEHPPGFEAIRGLWITRLLGLGTDQRIATPRDGLGRTRLSIRPRIISVFNPSTTRAQ